MMVKKFNVKGVCVPHKHYMVDISDRLKKMKALVDSEEYFVINRARQYGKTTTIAALKKYLSDEYIVILFSFQGLGAASFETEAKFCQKLLANIAHNLGFSTVPADYVAEWENKEVEDFTLLSRHITKMCKDKKVVLMIDEVDKASNYRVFIDFLAILRDKYQARSMDEDITFHSVILVGVYDIKNIKLKMIKAGTYQPVKGENINESPWNIAENYDGEMAFSAKEIVSMLASYESDHQTGMDILDVAKEIYSFTSGYPFLVSRICQYIDEKLKKDWCRQSVVKAVQLITEEPQPNTLFDDLFKNMRSNKDLSIFLYRILIERKMFTYSQGDEIIEQGLRYAFIRIINGQVKIHNKIFEVIMISYFISKERREEKKFIDTPLDGEVVSGKHFNIELFFEKFNAHYQRNYEDKDRRFLEREATFLFLFFLQPYLNGKGFFHMQSQPNLATGKQMDVVINYGNQEYIIELKVWHGQKYQEDAYQQLIDYMGERGAEKGYLLTFDFRQKKQIKHAWIEVGDKPILEVQV